MPVHDKEGRPAGLQTPNNLGTSLGILILILGVELLLALAGHLFGVKPGGQLRHSGRVKFDILLRRRNDVLALVRCGCRGGNLGELGV